MAALRALPRGAQRVAVFLAAVVAATTLTAIVTAAPAVADNGDGIWNCSNGEICFKKHSDSNWNRDIRHFWYSAQHSGNWCACDGGEGGAFLESASMYWNRDTQCTAFWLDELGSYYTMPRGASWYQYIGWWWNDSNWAHTRCDVNQPWGT